MKYYYILVFVICFARVEAQQKPNVLFIYVDDLGYGDLGCYGSDKIKTPHIDRLAKQGKIFTNAHTTSATCTPSRYSLLTGKYAFRRNDTGVATGDASALIPANTQTIASIFGQAGYQSAVIGKWHLGLGPQGGPDWNGKIVNGPLDIGFNYAYILPATGDRVPCVYVENDHVVNLDPSDPIQVSYGKKIGNRPTGKENPELLSMVHSHGHDNTIINGVGRIGFMQGGQAALWQDENISQRLTNQAKKFIGQHQKKPFFVYFATHDIHVPRVPNGKFLGKSGYGNRGDALLQLDDAVGQLMFTLDSLKLTKNTLVILTSDNGPVVDDGYQDGSKENLKDYKPSGVLRGGKYSAFESGTRVPMLARWPAKISPGKSNALISQIDFLATMSAMLHQNFDSKSAFDSQNQLNAWLGLTQKGRPFIIEQAGTLSVVKDDWKYIKPSKGGKFNALVNIELGNDSEDQLYDLKNDISEKNNLSTSPKHLNRLTELKALLKDQIYLK